MSRRNRKFKEFRTRKRRELSGLQVATNQNMEIRHRERQVIIVPRNIHQDDLLGLLEDPQKHIVFAMGPAGTGKTLISTLYAIRALKLHHCDKIIITRPAVSVDEQHGFLPGSLVEKMAPWVLPIMDIFQEYYSPAHIENMIEEGVIEIAPLAYMRGRTFKNSIILADEMQNATDSQMKMLLTRVGEHSKLIVTGDLAQFDRGYESNGLKMFTEKMKQIGSDLIAVMEFGNGDIERHPVVDEVLRIYGS